MNNDVEVQNSKQSPDMNNLGSLLGGLQNNKHKEEPNSKPKTYEEYKKEKKKEQYENEYKEFKQSMQRVDKYLKKFDKSKLSEKKKQEIEDLKRWVKGGADIKEKLKNVLSALDRLVDIIFSVVLFGFAGIVTEKQIQNDKKNINIALKNKMGIPLEGKEKEMFNRYQQEKQQEEKEKQEEKDKKNKKVKNQSKEQKKFEENKKNTNMSATQDNDNKKITSAETQDNKREDGKGTFFDNLLALEEKKKQQEQQKKEEEQKTEEIQKQEEEKNNKVGKQKEGNVKKTIQEDTNAMETSKGLKKIDEVAKQPVNVEQELKEKGENISLDASKTSMKQDEERQLSANVIDKTTKTNNINIDVEKILSKKQEQALQSSQKISNQLENINKTINTTNTNIEKTDETLKNNAQNSDNMEEKEGLTSSQEIPEADKKMVFNLEPKQINNNTIIPNNKQNDNKMTVG